MKDQTILQFLDRPVGGLLKCRNVKNARLENVWKIVGLEYAECNTGKCGNKK